MQLTDTTEKLTKCRKTKNFHIPSQLNHSISWDVILKVIKFRFCLKLLFFSTWVLNYFLTNNWLWKLSWYAIFSLPHLQMVLHRFLIRAWACPDLLTCNRRLSHFGKVCKCFGWQTIISHDRFPAYFWFESMYHFYYKFPNIIIISVSICNIL